MTRSSYVNLVDCTLTTSSNTSLTFVSPSRQSPRRDPAHGPYDTVGEHHSYGKSSSRLPRVDRLRKMVSVYPEDPAEGHPILYLSGGALVLVHWLVS